MLTGIVIFKIGNQMTDYFDHNLRQHIDTFRSLENCKVQVSIAVDMIVDALSSGNKILFCGNGGSAADCQHIAAEFTGRFTKDRRPLAGLALTTDTSALTCIANDYDFTKVFSRQILALGKPGDIVVGISTSGMSPNISDAMSTAKDAGIRTIGLLGKDGGTIKDICDHAIIVPSMDTARIQEAHIFVGHVICGAVEQQLGLV